MSHLIYDGLVTVDNLGTEFDTSANPIVLKLDPTITKLPSGALKANVSGALTGTNLSLNGGAPINLLPAIKAGETVTVMAYDSAAKKITYTNEAGTLVTIDLSSIAADIYTTVGNYDAATMTITLIDNDGATPNITINLADLKKVVTSNSPSVSFTGTGEASSPLIATVTAIPAGVTIPASQISAGTLGAGVITPAANIGPGPLPSATTIAPSQITAGALPANVTVPGGNITGVIDPTVMTDSTTHSNKWTKADGVTESVNGVPSDIPIPKAVLEDVLGYDIKGIPSWEPKASFAGSLTIGAGQIGPGTLGAGVAVPPANLGAGPLPATTTVPGGNITGVITPAVMTASTTNTLAVTGPNLVSTVNGVAASVPMASIVPATTHVNTWTKAAGLKETVNGVASDIPIVAGTIVETLGYNAAGVPVYQPVVVPGDFFRSTTGNTLPDGQNDLTEKIYHTGSIGVGQADPQAKLHILGSGTSSVVPVAGNGIIISDGTSPRIYLETSGAATGQRVMLLESNSGATKFGSLNDNGSAFVKQDILAMSHATGDLFVSGYPNTRNDPGAPVNVLTTNAFGAVESHPITDLLVAYSYKNPNPPPTVWATVNAGGAPGGVIVDGTPAFRTLNANYASPLTLPPVTAASVPIVIQCDSTFDLGIAATNTTLPKELLVKSGFCVRMVPGGDGKWHWIDSEVNPPVPTVVLNTNAALSGGYTVPSQTVVGSVTTYTNLVTIAQSTPITIPSPANYPKNEPLYLKTLGAWTGSIVVTPAGGQIDQAATYTFNKASATLKPSITVMHDGFNWYVV